MTELAKPVPVAQIERDRWDRPLVMPPGGGRAVPYTRCTTFVGCIEDTYNLSRWQARMVALGLSMRPDLLLAVSAHSDDKARLNRICEDAKEAAAANAAATTGTALHALTERMDRGLDLGPIPEAYQADLDAYADATRDLKPTLIEQFMVCDALKVGGTPDRVVTYQGKRYIADLKTGTIHLGILKICMQLAVYARSAVYDVATGERSTHGAEVDKGIVIHLPAGEGHAQLVWVDLMAGWSAVRVARDIREKRKLKFDDLAIPFDTGGAVVESLTDSLAAQIRACATAEDVRALWSPEWPADLVEVARAHVASLQASA